MANRMEMPVEATDNTALDHRHQQNLREKLRQLKKLYRDERSRNENMDQLLQKLLEQNEHKESIIAKHEAEKEEMERRLHSMEQQIAQLQEQLQGQTASPRPVTFNAETDSQEHDLEEACCSMASDLSSDGGLPEPAQLSDEEN